MSSLPSPTESWRTNAELIVANAQEGRAMIPSAAFPVRMMLKASGATALLDQLANADVAFETENEAKQWFEENEPTFSRVLDLYERAGSFLDEGSSRVASEWKTWFENTR